MIDVASVRERFERHYIPEPNSGCWLWIGCCDHVGYGHFKMGTGCSPSKAHRVVWELYCGPIPRGLCVLHKCDMPPCVNPEHLFLGTHADNAADRGRKHREFHPAGELHPMRKIDLAAARSIRFDTRNQYVIAAEYGISQGHVSAIKSGNMLIRLRHTNAEAY